MLNWSLKNLFQTDGELILIMITNNMKLPKLYVDSSAFSEDILAFTETWMKTEISNSEVLSKNTYRSDRYPRRGSGVLVAVTSTLTSERIYFLNPNDIEFVGVKVSLKSFSIYVFLYSTWIRLNNL